MSTKNGNSSNGEPPKEEGSSMKWILGGLGIGACALYMASFGMLATFVGSTEQWVVIKPQLMKVFWVMLTGLIVSLVATYLYFSANGEKGIFLYMILTCVSLCLSFAALAASAIAK